MNYTVILSIINYDCDYLFPLLKEDYLMHQTKCYAALSQNSPLIHHTISRREIGKKDVFVEIEFCGVCHTDYHYAKNDWGITKYPFVGGHEIIGVVKKLGVDVKKFNLGDRVAVGCFVNSCRACNSCHNNLEQYCANGLVKTYNDPTLDPGGYTFGGYSKSIVVDEHFVFSVPQNLDPAGAAPLLCAGITTFSPLNHWRVGQGMNVGIIGLGGLGHMAVKFASAMGANTTVFTTSEKKTIDGYRLGADNVVLSFDQSALRKKNGNFDFILDTVPIPHEVSKYMPLLKVDGTLCVVGSIGSTGELNTRPLIFGRRRIAGSLVGGMKETQKMLSFCGEKNITSDVEIIKIQTINEAYDRMRKNDVKYRFVIDMRKFSN
tara:strand:- start:1468 stop:2595 length:1128 start_codon:yes stop_codon:yes gene_type:complete